MNIAVLGNGVEGQAVIDYYCRLGEGGQIDVHDKFSDEKLPSYNLSSYDLVFRSPSVKPVYLLEKKLGKGALGDTSNWTSSTKMFFEKCPAPIIGVTGTKGKGTTASLIATLLRQLYGDERKVHLIGNIGDPAIKSLNKVRASDVVVYELSSFQLWDLDKSPHIAVVLRIEPDHLDRHEDFSDYVMAKANIARFQNKDDTVIYYASNEKSEEISKYSKGRKVPYKAHEENEYPILNTLKIPGAHNKENALAALKAVAAFMGTDIKELLKDSKRRTAIRIVFEGFKGLPHRLEFVESKNGVDYYDDSYSSAFPALDVAVKTFEDRPVVLIAGGKDRNLSLDKVKKRIFGSKNVKMAVLIGETSRKLAEGEDEKKYVLAESLKEAVRIAQKTAEELAVEDDAKNPVVLLSPGAASFDMFKNFEERGQKFQRFVKAIK